MLGSMNTFLPPSIVQMRMSQPPGVYIQSHISSSRITLSSGTDSLICTVCQLGNCTSQ